MTQLTKPIRVHSMFCRGFEDITVHTQEELFKEVGRLANESNGSSILCVQPDGARLSAALDAVEQLADGTFVQTQDWKDCGRGDNIWQDTFLRYGGDSSKMPISFDQHVRESILAANSIMISSTFYGGW